MLARGDPAQVSEASEKYFRDVYDYLTANRCRRRVRHELRDDARLGWTPGHPAVMLGMALIALAMLWYFREQGYV